MSDIQMPITEADILAQVVAPGEPGLPAESARAILDLHFDQTALRRMGVLAEKNNQGILTVAESEEMEKYLRVGNFLDLMQAKARLSLKSTG